MDNRDEDTARRSAETLAAASALIAAEMAAAGPDTYISNEKGPTPASRMDPVWAERAERASRKAAGRLTIPASSAASIKERTKGELVRTCFRMTARGDMKPPLAWTVTA